MREAERSFSFGSTCARCGHCTERKLSFDVAFVGRRYPPDIGPCEACGSKARAGDHGDLPAFDDGTALTRWARDPEVCFLDQDEDLVIAAAPASHIVDALNDPTTDRSRRFDLIGALLLHGVGEDEAQRQIALDWLHRHRAAWEKQKAYGYQRLRRPVLAALNSR